MTEMNPVNTTDETPAGPLYGLVHDAFERLTWLYQRNAMPSFGLRDLDEQLMERQLGQLILLTDVTGVGRSALALRLAMGAPAQQDTLLFSASLSAHHVILRLLSSEGRVDLNRIFGGQLNERDFERLAVAANARSERRLFIVDAHAFTVERLLAAAREQHAATPLTRVIVDGMELLDVAPGAPLDDALLRLRVLCRELNGPVVVTLPLGAALERRSYPHKRPRLGDIEIAPRAADIADTVLGLYRDEMYNIRTEQQGIAEILVLKQALGPVGTAKVQFHTAHSRFNDLAPEGV